MKCDELTPIDLECNMGPDVNGVVHREPWKAYDIDEVDILIDKKDSEINELRDECAELHNRVATLLSQIRIRDERIDELKAKLENVQASAYAESVDAGMRERRLKRVLWLARANRAKEKQQLFLFSLDFEKLCIDGFYDPYSGRRELSPKQWIKAFNKVEVKLLKKAKEYK